MMKDRLVKRGVFHFLRTLKMRLHGFIVMLALAVMCTSFTATAGSRVTVYAAASLTNALGEVAAQYEKEKSVKIVGSYASSSALAKQIEYGAPADLFISADMKWMDYLRDKKKIVAGSQRPLLGNQLVLISPHSHPFKVLMAPSFDIADEVDGKLCTGDTEAVPVGIYARQSLMALRWWDALRSRIVGTQDVRSALALVERGECAAGIVYETDAKISKNVLILATFPEETHEPIVYPIAMVTESPEAKAFYAYLMSPKAMEVFERYGFTPLDR
jgi:molybdate transport system substrate-binding protein